MKITTLLIAFVSAFSLKAAAETVTWTPQTAKVSYTNMRAFYSCDYAESQTEHYLELLGARDIKVRCTGGLPDFQSVNLTAEFLAPVISTDGVEAEWQAVTLKARESCDFNETIAKRVMKYFPTRANEAQSSCWASEGSFSSTLEVLK